MHSTKMYCFQNNIIFCHQVLSTNYFHLLPGGMNPRKEWWGTSHTQPFISLSPLLSQRELLVRPLRGISCSQQDMKWKPVHSLLQLLLCWHNAAVYFLFPSLPGQGCSPGAAMGQACIWHPSFLKALLLAEGLGHRHPTTHPEVIHRTGCT